MDGYRIHFESNCIYSLTDLKTKVDVSDSNSKSKLAKLMKCKVPGAPEVELVWQALKGSR